ncbi:MAG TPA: hypothetical protein VNA12_01290 [Mycobacteriales bacterium]|nr:hypothetical protein [Mycobacteriales bacterium]
MLAGLWAAVLIPATMRSRDHAHDGRSIEGFHTAMRTLSRRTPPDSRRIVVPAPHVTSDGPALPSLARRRAALLRTSAIVLATFGYAVAAGGRSWLLHLAADAALVAVVMWLRRTALAEAAQARQQRRAQQELRAHREAAELATYRARAARRTFEDLPQRRAVGD